MTPRQVVLLALAAGVVAGCGGDEFGDLKQELNELTKDVRGKIPPLPQVKPYEPVPYTAETEIDPFRPERIIVAKAGGAPRPTSKLAPDPNRTKEPLEAFSLESIQMVGSFLQDSGNYGLVKAGPNLYRVGVGSYMGQNYGVVTNIEEAQITLRELVQDSGGDWVERVNALQLQEGGKR